MLSDKPSLQLFGPLAILLYIRWARCHYAKNLALNFLCSPVETDVYVRDVPWDCASYVMCISGLAVPRPCPMGKLYAGSGWNLKCEPAEEVNATRCVGQVWEYLDEVCRQNPRATLPDPAHCALYYDCSLPQDDDDGQFMQHLLECPYPSLYSTDTAACKDYRFVSCGQRLEPTAPCDYHQYRQRYNCSDSNCLQCNRFHPSCKGLRNGHQTVIGTWDFTMVCDHDRTLHVLARGKHNEEMELYSAFEINTRIGELEPTTSSLPGIHQLTPPLLTFALSKEVSSEFLHLSSFTLFPSIHVPVLIRETDKSIKITTAEQQSLIESHTHITELQVLTMRPERSETTTHVEPWQHALLSLIESTYPKYMPPNLTEPSLFNLTINESFGSSALNSAQNSTLFLPRIEPSVIHQFNTATVSSTRSDIALVNSASPTTIEPSTDFDPPASQSTAYAFLRDTQSSISTDASIMIFTLTSVIDPSRAINTGDFVTQRSVPIISNRLSLFIQAPTSTQETRPSTFKVSSQIESIKSQSSMVSPVRSSLFQSAVTSQVHSSTSKSFSRGQVTSSTPQPSRIRIISFFNMTIYK